MATWSTPLETVRRVVDRDDCTIFDVGAHVGDMTELYRVMFAHPVIHAFEPLPDAFATLSAKFDNADGVVLNKFALGAAPGTAVLHQNNRTGTSSLLRLHPASSWAKGEALAEVKTVEVSVDTIDNYCAARGIGSIDLLKLDVQGFEPDCLRGAAAMLRKHAIRVILTEIITHRIYERRTSFLDIESLLLPCGYRLFNLFDGISGYGGELLQLDALYVLEGEHA
jgi:FkbM family methyltransferase